MLVGFISLLAPGGCSGGAEASAPELPNPGAGGAAQGGGGGAEGGAGGADACDTDPVDFCRKPDPAAGPGCCGATVEARCRGDRSGFECPEGTIRTSECAACEELSCADQGRLPPPGLMRDTTALSTVSNDTLSAPTLTWQDVFNEPFPDGGTVFLKTQRDRYISLELSTAGLAPGAGGAYDIANPQGTANFGLSLVTLSECPGDFTDQADPDCKKLINNNRMEIVVGESGGIVGCEIEPNKTYYLNVLHTTDAEAPFEWECGFSPGVPSNTGEPDACRDLVQFLPNID